MNNGKNDGKIHSGELGTTFNLNTAVQLKADICRCVTELHEDIPLLGTEGAKERLTDDMANIIALSYILCRRIGIESGEIKDCMIKKLDIAIGEKQPIEETFGDLSAVKEMLKREA